jgi:polysaccharide chain length determinant protein (PEP-CTERM system associated)
LNSLVEDTIGAGQEGSDTASRFLDERIADYEHRLQEAEEALAQFKRRNSDRLPSSTGGYFEMLRHARDSLAAAERERRLARSRQEQIRAQLQSESPVMPSGAGPPADLDPNSLDARIRDYRARLDRLLLEFTERHPDVINAREALARLEEQRAAQLRSLGVLDLDQEIAGLGSNPVYQSLRIALNEVDVQIAAIDADIAERTSEVTRLQSLIDEVPEVEAELARLNRDYNVIYEQYQSLVRSRETQDLSRKARSADDVQFRVIDPPLAALQPVSPNRLVLLGAALCGAFAAGAGLCWLLAQLRPVFSTASELATITSFPVLGTVSRALPRRQRRKRLFAHVAFSGVIAALAAICAVAVLVEIAGPGMRAMVGLA